MRERRIKLATKLWIVAQHHVRGFKPPSFSYQIADGYLAPAVGVDAVRATKAKTAPSRQMLAKLPAIWARAKRHEE
jgi:hypothetical protein